MATQALAANGEKFRLSITVESLQSPGPEEPFPTANRDPGAKVYITGRRMEVLEIAAKAHTPEEGGQIIP